MAIRFKKGNIVKYKDRDGNKSGGTIIDIISENGEKYALINSVDGANVRKRVSDLSLICRQQRGRVSSKFMEEFKEELELENTKDEPKNPVDSESMIDNGITAEQSISVNEANETVSLIDKNTISQDVNLDDSDNLKKQIYSLKQRIAEQIAEINDKNEELVSLRRKIKEIVEENNSINEELKRKLAMEEHKRKEAEKRLQDSVKGVHTTSLTLNQNVDKDSLERMKMSLTGMSNTIQAFAMKLDADAINHLVETIMKLNGL